MKHPNITLSGFSRHIQNLVTAILSALRTNAFPIEVAGDIRWQTRTGLRWMEGGLFQVGI